jgi:hypothetical protein
MNDTNEQVQNCGSRGDEALTDPLRSSRSSVELESDSAALITQSSDAPRSTLHAPLSFAIPASDLPAFARLPDAVRTETSTTLLLLRQIHYAKSKSAEAAPSPPNTNIVAASATNPSSANTTLTSIHSATGAKSSTKPNAAPLSGTPTPPPASRATSSNSGNPSANATSAKPLPPAANSSASGKPAKAWTPPPAGKNITNQVSRLSRLVPLRALRVSA